MSEDIGDRINKLRDKAKNTRITTAVYAGITALGAFETAFEISEHFPDTAIGVTVAIATAAMFGFSVDRTIKSIQVGQEVAALSAIKAQAQQEREARIDKAIRHE